MVLGSSVDAPYEFTHKGGIHDHTDNRMFEADVLRLDVGVGDALVVYPR